MSNLPGHCLLCGNNALNVVDVIDSRYVVEAYSAAFGVDVGGYYRPGARLSLVSCSNCGLMHYDPMPTGDEAFYEALQRHPWYYQDSKPEYDFAKDYIGQQNNVLEVGCGKGIFRSFLQPTVTYRGLEFNAGAIEMATASGLHVTAENIETHADVHREEYDVVCHFQVLEHVSDPKGFLSSCVKALKPGGKLVVAVPAEDSFLSICEDGWLNMPPHHVTRWKDSAIMYAFERVLGIRVEAIWHEPVASYHLDWHRTVLANYALKNLFFQKTGLARTGIAARAIFHLATSGLFVNRLFNRSMRQYMFPTHGHTVCVVGSK